MCFEETANDYYYAARADPSNIACVVLRSYRVQNHPKLCQQQVSSPFSSSWASPRCCSKSLSIRVLGVDDEKSGIEITMSEREFFESYSTVFKMSDGSSPQRVADGDIAGHFLCVVVVLVVSG
jgi:hypothetical protein